MVGLLHAAPLLAVATLATLVEAKDRCTAIIVGAKASTTGTPMTTHTNDCSSCDFRIAKVPAQTHEDGAQHDVVLAAFDYPRYVGGARGKEYLPENLDTRFYNWTATPAIGSIPEVPQTFAYIEGAYGIINEHQVAIGESTCPARFWTKPVTQGGEALFDVGELSRIALQRAQTAREAVQLMGDLAVQYGYYGAVWEGKDVYDEAGEALTVTDTKEAWIFHILPDDTGKSAIWAAQRVPDNQISGVANQFVIRELDLNRPSYFLASPNVHDVAIRNNLWKPDQGTPFDFTLAYAQPRKDTHQYYSTRRIWRLFTLANPELKLSPETDVLASDYPFSVKPASPLSPRDIMRFQRDHYEGTPFDMTKGPKSGPYGDPDRYDAAPNDDLTQEDIDRGHFERAISIFRASYSFVSILDPYNPDNAFLWFGQYAPHATTYTPVFVQSTDVPKQLSRGSLYAFDRESSFWIHALVGNWAARFYSHARPFVARVQDEVESHAEGMLRSVLIEAEQHKREGGVPAMVDFLTKQSDTFAQRAHRASSDLFDYLVTAFHDGYQVSNFYAKMLTVQSIFYPKWWLQQVGFFDGAEESGDAEPASAESATTAPASSSSGVATTAKTKIIEVAHKGSVSYFTTTVLVILSGLAGLFLGRKFHGPLTNKKQGYRPLHVTLHVYDLSHGMARQLSPALLGKTIDGVWHTGVLVFGKEYFFGGGGIQAMAPELVVQRYGMQPVRTITLGETTQTQQQLEQFLRENSARFTDATYDLLRHNCNNFSDEVAKFLVGSGIPQYILDLPNEALNSPFGAMLRPMLDNMNNQMHAAPGDQLFSIPFNDPSRANLAVPAVVTSTPATTPSVDLASRRFKISGSPALHLDKMVQRIKSLNTENLLSEDEVLSLDALSVHIAEDNKEAGSTKSVEWWKIVSKLLSQGHQSAFFFPALGLTRVLLLLPANSKAATEKDACFEAVVHVTEVEPSPLTSAQKTLLLAVLLNAFANPGFSDMALSGSTRFLPFVFATIADPSTGQDPRVLSAHIISNCCLAMKIGEEVVVTTIVCGAVETLDRISRLQPTSAVQQQTIEGIIVGLGRLLHNFEAARSLCVELGLAEVIRRLNVTPGLNAIQPLLSEVVQLI
ncbi:hypothetical protein JG687_00003672 [Phytophthora cactorum]|uniref:Peptidase n=1 Tax=Phytophthora cactorum TaxID=29920 RepID=A0A8T1UQU7_9STRA|nr:hypothetical protein JG687_00003672 [Phytophthora cactorum]